MCFSATASFTAGTALTLIGGASIAQTKSRNEWMFASMPLLFGIQQFIEGVIWLSFGMPVLSQIMGYGFLFFSHVLWPTFVPLSIFFLERSPLRRKLLTIFVIMGAVVSLYFLYYLFTENVKPEIAYKSIAYVGPHFFVTFILSPYTIATCASCLLSSHRIVNLFGVVTFLSAVIAFRFYEYTFVSVWCFFAAILSAIVLVHFYRERRRA
jgi:hypothetical protein